MYVTHDQAEAFVTSDRIVVMNQGRIEQVDTPQRLYERPRTRFVASFIGRTNLLRGRHAGGRLELFGASMPASAFEGSADWGPEVLLSVRPQHIRLEAAAPAAPDGRLWLEGRVAQRAYLGEYWELFVVPRGADERIRVSVASAPPPDETVWLGIDPAQAVRVE